MREDRHLTAEVQTTMRRGSVSFSLASRLLDGTVRNSVLMLYSWCRYCDDTIDGQTLGSQELSTGGEEDPLFQQRQHEKLAHLAYMTKLAMQGQMRDGPAAMHALAYVASRHSLPAAYIDEFLAGMRMDVERRSYATFEELLLYCYRVAGTVGLLFLHITGASNAAARRHAAELGMAMQLTNIARDLAADYRAGRIYLPSSWLTESGLTPENLLDAQHRTKLFDLVQRLLTIADQYYRSGDEGLQYLPRKAALGVAAARHIYGEIGHRIRRLGPRAWDQRVVVSTPKKLWLLTRAWAQVARSWPTSTATPWQTEPLTDVWRLP